MLTEKNVATDSAKWSYAKSQAKKKFDVYPSQYANAWAVKKYNELGGTWRKEESVDMYNDPDDIENKNNTLFRHRMKKNAIKEKLRRVVELMVAKEMKQPISESDAQFDKMKFVETLRDMTDDLMMQTEMLIDSHYGELDMKEFKKRWIAFTDDFEKKFDNMSKNL